MVYVHVAAMPVLIGDTFLNSTIETIKHHFILYTIIICVSNVFGTDNSIPSAKG